MPRLNNLPLDTTIAQNDQFLVTDTSSNNATKRFSVSQLGAFFAGEGFADVGKVASLYELKSTTPNAAGQAQASGLTATNVPASQIRTLIVSREDLAGINKRPMWNFTEGATIKISGAEGNSDTNYALYTLNNVSDGGGTNINLDLTYSSGSTNAVFAVDSNISLVPFASGTNAPAVRATQLRYGDGAPANSVGRDGDFYIDETNSRLYGPKTNGAWSSDFTSLIGPAAGFGTPTATRLNSNQAPTVVASGPDTAKIFTFGIPAGEDGNDGAAAGFGTVTVNTLAPGSDATVTTSGPDTAKNFVLGIPRGATGQTGQTGNQGPVGPAAGFGDINVTTLAAGSNATITETGPDTAKNITIGIPRGATGEKGDQGDTGNTGAAAGFGTPTATGLSEGASPTVTASGPDTAKIFTFGIPVGATGATGAAGSDGRTIHSGSGAPPSGTGVTGDYFFDSTNDRFYGPKTNDTTWPNTFVSMRGTSTLDITEGGTTLSDINSLTVVGTGISLTGSGTSATLTFHGGGGAQTPPTMVLSQTGFVEDRFSNVAQFITFNAAVTANDATITSVVFTPSASEWSAVTDTSSPYTSGSQGMRPGSDDSVTVTATLNYTLPGEAAATLTETITLTTNKTRPTRQNLLGTALSFRFTPANDHIEYFDSGSFTINTYSGATNGWTVGTQTFSPTLSSGVLNVTGGSSDLDFNVTAPITQTSPPSGQTAISVSGYQINSDNTYTRIRSVRTGGKSSTAFTAAAIRVVSNWHGSTGTNLLHFGTVNPDGEAFDMTCSDGQRLYIMYDATYADIDPVNTRDSNGARIFQVHTWNKTTVDGFKIYETTDTFAAIAASDGYAITVRLQS